MATRVAKLREYHDTQAQIVEHQNAVVRRGYIDSPADIYPDIEFVNHSSYVRTPLPLGFLVLLYDRTVIFVPPVSESELAARFGLPFAKILALSRAKVVLPIIGNALDYGADHFDELLDLKPPSLWARGVCLLEQLGMGATLTEDGCPLPVREMAQLDSLRSKYATRFPTLDPETLEARTRQEILTNYADMCIFGEQAVADRLAALGDAQRTVDRLLLVNEVRTYPILFGMGGTANYDSRSILNESASHQTLSPLRDASSDVSVLPHNLGVLLDGVGITVQNMSARDIAAFHADGKGRRLRAAVQHFEEQAKKAVSGLSDSQMILGYAQSLQEQIRYAAVEISSPSFIRGAALAARFNPGLANLWRIMTPRQAAT
jgi:hypothetical protein